MANDFIPRADGEFETFFIAFNNWVQANGATHGLSVGQIAESNDAYGDWGPAYSAHLTAQTAALSAAQAKDTQRAAVEPVIRTLARVIQAHPDTTDGERVSLGLTVRDTTRTAAAVPTTRPIAMVDTGQRLRHTIHFKDELTPNSKKKPDGVMGAEIWCYIGANPPADASTCSFVALDTSTPYVVDYEGANANKVAHYLLRWVNTRGEKGPWSETVSATIGA